MDAEFQRHICTRREFAALIKRSVSTVKRLEKTGVVTPKRDKMGGVFFTQEDVEDFLQLHSQGDSHDN